MAQKAGTKKRTYPPLSLDEAMRVPATIQDQASGMPLSRLTLAELLKVSPSSSNFSNLVASSRLYGLTSGGINADEFGLTPLGEKATGADEVEQLAARKAAVMNIDPYGEFFERFKNKKVPGSAAFREFLVKNAGIPDERAEECMRFILADATSAGLIRKVQGGDWVDLSGAPISSNSGFVDHESQAESPLRPDNDMEESSEGPSEDPSQREEKGHDQREPNPTGPKKLFIAHGTNRVPLEQLKKALDQFKVKYAVAVDEPNKGRPISRKVAQLMRDECSAGIFIFTADEAFLRVREDGEQETVWRPRENVVYELGAASILYENRIVIFKERGVTFPSDFSDLGYIEFEKDQLATEIGSLFSELVGLDILEVRAKG